MLPSGGHGAGTKKRIPAGRKCLPRVQLARIEKSISECWTVFESRLQIDPINRSRLVNIQFDSHDPALAARVANSLAENYIEQNLQARWTATQKAADWLSQQLSGVKARLEKSEEHLHDYARRNDLVFLESDKEPSRNVENEQVQQLQEELTKAEAQRYEKEAL